MSSSSVIDQEKDKWSIECPGHFFWNSSIRRLYQSLQRELNPEYFELLEFQSLRYRLATWRDFSSWVLDRIFKVLEKDGFSYTMRFRGVRVSMTAIYLHGYFEVNQHFVEFSQLRANIDRIFREYGCPLSLGAFGIPIVRFKNTVSSKHLPNLDRWEECEFGELRMNEWRVSRGGNGYGKVPLQQFIAHRGNVESRFAPDENKPSKIEELNRKGIACEIDVWYKDNKYWLGHDAPETEISFDWLMEYLPLRLIHCKNRSALDMLHRECGRHGFNVNLFYHTVEDYAITSRGHIIVHPDQICLPDSIEMMPELSKDRDMKYRSNTVCSDSRSYLRPFKLSAVHSDLEDDGNN
jgi:hypothetical protein